ncbi:hypothetical protein [Photorhabdus heterorhabditis]|uniref:hypothetical protein n=1 Tax=Photorhabdus heterorhabditis TaxID=880156 RepID=UPI001BD24559|nr:hypothetical protein [Photorhabdus heterorhabditis]
MHKIRTVAETLAVLHQYHHLAGIERQPKQLKTLDFDDKVIFSNDPKTATVPPAFFTVQTIQELKALGGVPDSEYGPGKMEPHHPLPEPFSAERLANVSGNHIDLCKAFRAYIYSDSALVKDYEEILNAKRFPMKVALYSGEKMTVASDNPLVVEDKDDYGEPVVLVYDQIIIEPGGQIIYRTNGRIEASTIVGNGSDQKPNIISKSDDGGDGFDGETGCDGSNGGDGVAGIENKYGCAVESTAGSDATGGSSGGLGVGGGEGGNANDIVIHVQLVTGSVNVESIGGKGGNGGDGGDGGNGGIGGNGGNKTGKSSAGRAGNGGNGGDGGDAGNGGKGGDSGNVYINFLGGQPVINTQSYRGNGGNGGKGGKGGKGGDGGKGGVGNSSQSGVSGRDGIDGKSGGVGVAGKIYINGNVQS